MKRIIILLLVLTTIFTAAACAKEETVKEQSEIEITTGNFLEYFSVILNEERGSYYKMVTFQTLDVSYRIEPKARFDIVSPIAVGIHIHANNTDPDLAGDETVYLDLSATGAGTGKVDFLAVIFSFKEVTYDIVSARGAIKLR